MVHRAWYGILGGLVALSLATVTAGCKKENADTDKKGGGEPAAEPAGGGEPAAAAGDLAPPPRGDDPCSKLCAKSFDELVGLLKWEEDQAKRKAKYDEMVLHEKQCNTWCSAHVAAGGPAKELIDRIFKDCGEKTGFDFPTCTGEINEEWRTNHGGDDAPQFSSGNDLCRKRYGCAEDQ